MEAFDRMVRMVFQASQDEQVSERKFEAVRC